MHPSFWRKFFHPIHVPLLKNAEKTVKSFTASGRALFYVLSGLIFFSAAGLLYLLNNDLKVEVPMHRGSYSEGIIGTPRFINPVLAISEADRDMVTLIYSGLLKPDAEGGFSHDLAESYTVSEDGKTYTVHMRKNAQFQNGSAVTADDVAFTVAKALDPAVKSPLRANWEGVHVTVIDPHTVEFSLSKPYSPFIENLALGILPKALWENVSAEEFPYSELNTSPIGSGPYKVSKISRNSSGIPTSYDLLAYSDYALGQPYLSKLTLRFYQSQESLIAALKRGEVEGGGGISPSLLNDVEGLNAVSIPLNRVFGVFFNQNQSTVLRDADVRKALSHAINRDDLIATVLGGYGTVLTGPIPPTISASEVPDFVTEDETSSVLATMATRLSDPVAEARATLTDAGWVLGEDGVLTKTTGTGKNAQTETLAFSLSTSNVPELVTAVNYLSDAWTSMGARVSVEVYNQGDLSETVIRPRKYDALLFGEIVGRGFDLFAFWDSSQRNDPGLNIALYANPTVDSLLRDLRTAGSDNERRELYNKIAEQIEADTPAAFLYSPDYIYILPKDLQGASFGVIENPNSRFNTVEKWYRQTDSVWGVFAR